MSATDEACVLALLQALKLADYLPPHRLAWARRELLTLFREARREERERAIAIVEQTVSRDTRGDTIERIRDGE